MVAESQPSVPRLAAGILGLFVIGTPVVAYLWETLNRLISGHVEPVRLLISIPVGLLLLFVLRLVTRFVGSAEQERQESIPLPREPRP